MSEKKPITEEGKQSLLLITKETSQETAKQLDTIRPFINDMMAMGENRKTLGLEPSPVEYGLIRLNEYNILIGFISKKINLFLSLSADFGPLHLSFNSPRTSIVVTNSVSGIIRAKSFGYLIRIFEQGICDRR